jgi:hypothetical protein
MQLNDLLPNHMLNSLPVNDWRRIMFFGNDKQVEDRRSCVNRLIELTEIGFSVIGMASEVVAGIQNYAKCLGVKMDTP